MHLGPDLPVGSWQLLVEELRNVPVQSVPLTSIKVDQVLRLRNLPRRRAACIDNHRGVNTTKTRSASGSWPPAIWHPNIQWRRPAASRRGLMPHLPPGDEWPLLSGAHLVSFPLGAPPVSRPGHVPVRSEWSGTAPRPGMNVLPSKVEAVEIS